MAAVSKKRKQQLREAAKRHVEREKERKRANAAKLLAQKEQREIAARERKRQIKMRQRVKAAALREQRKQREAALRKRRRERKRAKVKASQLSQKRRVAAFRALRMQRERDKKAAAKAAEQAIALHKKEQVRAVKLAEKTEHDRVQKLLAPLVRAKYNTIKDYVRALLLFAPSRDEHNRPIGLDYSEILQHVQKKFPVVMYPGPHFGKPSNMRLKDLVAIACELNSSDGAVKLPKRPRRRTTRKEAQ